MPQKRSWFGRKKKSSSGAHAASVSRPPSSATLGHSRSKATSGTPAVDDDLPPRMDSDATLTSPIRPEEPRLDTPGDVIPKHAGFDLAGMKEMLGNAKQHPEELKILTPGEVTNYPIPPIPPVSHRSQTAPPPAHEDSPSTTPVMKSSLRLPSQASDADLRTAFQRSVSVDAFRAEPAHVMSSHPPQSSQSASTSPRGAPPAGAYNAPWTSEPLSRNASQVLGQRFGQSTETLSFGNQNGSIAPFGNPFNTSLSHNPFTSPADFTSPSSGGISFGSTDGSITLSPAGNAAEQDPWTYRPPRSSSFNSNPWEA